MDPRTASFREEAGRSPQVVEAEVFPAIMAVQGTGNEHSGEKILEEGAAMGLLVGEEAVEEDGAGDHKECIVDLDLAVVAVLVVAVV